MTDYFFQERMSEGLVKLYSERYGPQIFSSRKLRKEARCAACRRALAKGESAWADVTSCAMNRSHRLCDECMSAGERDHAVGQRVRAGLKRWRRGRTRKEREHE